MTKKFQDMTCVPCQAGAPKMEDAEIREGLKQLEGWKVNGKGHLEKSFRFEDFASAMYFADDIGRMAEEQGHHPELRIGWGHVDVELWTHKIGGLHRNDFIMAAKTDLLKSE